MKKTTLLTCLLAVFIIATAFKTTEKKFPSVDLKTLDGETFNTDQFITNGKITVVSFWASWCKPCKLELDAISELHEGWVEDYGAEVVAITTDDARGLAKVNGIVSSKGWEFLVLSDSKQQLQRALSFQFIPQTFILDQNGNVIYEHNGYKPGDEIAIEDVLVEHSK